MCKLLRLCFVKECIKHHIRILLCIGTCEQLLRIMIVKDGGSHSGKWTPCFVRMCTLRHDYPRLLSELRPWIQLLSLLLATNIMYRYIIVFGGREGNGSGGRPCPPGYLYFKQSVYAHSHRTYPSFPGSPIMQMTVGDLEQGLQ